METNKISYERLLEIYKECLNETNAQQRKQQSVINKKLIGVKNTITVESDQMKLYMEYLEKLQNQR
ncbi:MAG: hypothetical protein FWF94_06005 [Oscillospiraceae bacterium]|nr:hypothetical protein [Oscillospiraceae bacterium]